MNRHTPGNEKKQAAAKYACGIALISAAQGEIKQSAIIGNAGRTISNYRPGSATTNVARAPKIDPDKPAVVDAAALPVRPAVSAYALPRPDIQRSDLAAPALMPATSLRGLY
jgi:hypothetical protein